MIALFREYFAQGDRQESVDCIAEIASSQRAEYCKRMVVRAIDLSLWERDKQQGMVTTLFTHLRDAGKQACEHSTKQSLATNQSTLRQQLRLCH